MRTAIASLAAVAIVLTGVALFAAGGGDDSDSTTTTTPAAVGDTGPAALGTTPEQDGEGSPSTTTSPPGSTTTPTTRPVTTRPHSTTVTAPPRTTAPNVEPNNPPVVTIGPPNPLQRFEAFFDAASGRFIASVPLTANVTDPEGDAFTVDWFSSLDGYLGSGRSITGGLSPDLDTSQPIITARATDATGAVGEGSIQIIVWIRSDE